MILIDGIIFSMQKMGGVSVYFKTLIEYLSKTRTETTLILDKASNGNVDLDKEGVLIEYQTSRFLERYRSCRIPAGGSVFHSSYYRRPNRSDIPTVVTVYDFIYERCRPGPRQWTHTPQKNAAIRAAQAVICISAATKDDLLEFVGETPGQTIHIVHLGVSEVFRNLHLEPAVPPYVLFVGQRGEYKNFSLALRAMTHLPDIALLCVGGGPLHPNELKGMPESVTKRIRHLGFVSDEDLNVLYNRALCLVYPSSIEGFGIPVLEAMRAGCPVVSADCKAVREIGGDALLVFEDAEPQAVAAAILKAAFSERLDLVNKGLSVAQRYSWDITHRQTLEIYRKLTH